MSFPHFDTHGNFGDKEHHQHTEHHQHAEHETDEDHYLEKLLKIANGELGDDYDILKEKHNPHKARKNYKKPVVSKEPLYHPTTSRSGYLPVSTTHKPTNDNTNYFNSKYSSPGSNHHEHEDVKKLSAIEDPYYEIPDSKSTYLPVPALPKQEGSYIDSSEDKYRNPASYYDNYEQSEPNQILLNEDPYYEVPQPKPVHELIPKTAKEDISFIKDSEQKYRNPINQHSSHNTANLKISKGIHETPYYESSSSNIGRESTSHQTIPGSDYNNLKSEDRYFNVPVVNDGYGGPEITLIGVGDLGDDSHRHFNNDHVKHKEEVYTITDQKETNVDAGRQHNGEGFATKDGFYYTRTEDYNPAKHSKLGSIVQPTGSQRISQYTEVRV